MIEQTIKVKVFTGSGSIDFEEDRKGKNRRSR